MRRTLVLMVTIAVGLFAAPRAAEAQEAGKVYRIGMIGPGRTDPGTEMIFRAFRERLQELGYVDGRNVIFERRWAEGRFERLPQLAEDLTAMNVDVIVAWGTPTVAAAKRVTTRTPIVMASSGDAVATGLVESLFRPGGNVTGVSWHHAELATKWLQLMISCFLAPSGFLFYGTLQILSTLSRVQALGRPPHK